MSSKSIYNQRNSIPIGQQRLVGYPENGGTTQVNVLYGRNGKELGHVTYHFNGPTNLHGPNLATLSGSATCSYKSGNKETESVVYFVIRRKSVLKWTK